MKDGVKRGERQRDRVRAGKCKWYPERMGRVGEEYKSAVTLHLSGKFGILEMSSTRELS